MSPLASLVPRVAIVTGAAQGIGRAIALRLASDGLDVALNDISSKSEALAAVAVELEALGRKALVVTADVSKEEEVKSLVQTVIQTLGRLDVVSIQIWLRLSILPQFEAMLDGCQRRGCFSAPKHHGRYARRVPY